MERVREAMQAVARENFLPSDVKPNAAADVPLPIGYGQTNSQPYTVRRMLEWLDVREGQRILDVGSGSGWTSALLAHLTGEHGTVYAVELVPELLAFGRDNCQRYGATNIEFCPAQASFGLPEYAPYDRILVSASAAELPAGLLDQLAIGGTMVVPIGSSIWEITKDRRGEVHRKKHPGFMFVPLIAAGSPGAN